MVLFTLQWVSFVQNIVKNSLKHKRKLPLYCNQPLAFKIYKQNWPASRIKLLGDLHKIAFVKLSVLALESIALRSL